jgi:hypothetical protein
MDNTPTPGSLKNFLRELRQALKLNRFFDQEIKVILDYYAFVIRKRVRKGEKLGIVLQDFPIRMIVKRHALNSLNFLTSNVEAEIPSFLNQNGFIPNFNDINEAFPDEKKIGSKKHHLYRFKQNK